MPTSNVFDAPTCSEPLPTLAVVSLFSISISILVGIMWYFVISCDFFDDNDVEILSCTNWPFLCLLLWSNLVRSSAFLKTGLCDFFVLNFLCFLVLKLELFFMYFTYKFFVSYLYCECFPAGGCPFIFLTMSFKRQKF